MHDTGCERTVGALRESGGAPRSPQQKSGVSRLPRKRKQKQRKRTSLKVIPREAFQAASETLPASVKGRRGSPRSTRRSGVAAGGANGGALRRICLSEGEAMTPRFGVVGKERRHRTQQQQLRVVRPAAVRVERHDLLRGSARVEAGNGRRDARRRVSQASSSTHSGK